MKNTFVKSICLLTGCLLLSQDGNTPTNLQIDAASVGVVTLSWDVPENYQKQWASHSNFIFQWGIGNQSLTPASYFHKFPDSLLADYHNMLVKQIAFVPSSISSWQPFVFQTDPNAPGDVPDLINYSNCVLSAPSSMYIDNFFSWKVHTLYNHVPGTSSNPFENDVDLSTFRIDSTKTLWYGYTVSDYQPYPAGSDVGPALEGLGNVIVYCGNQGCGETTLNQNAADGYTLDNNWMLAISLVTGDSTRANESPIILSSNTIPSRRMPSFVNSINPSMSIVAGARREIALFHIEELSREISNYFIFENDQVADVVQPTSNAGFNTTNREGTILGPRDPGFYYYYVKAQTASGVSEPSNTVSVDIQNNSPTEFSLIAPEAGALISVTHTNINNTISFITDLLNAITDSLQTAELSLENFKSNNPKIELNKKDYGDLYQIQKLDSEKAVLEVNKKYFIQILDYIKENDKIDNLIAPSAMGITDPLLNKVINDITELYSERKILLLNTTEKHPIIQNMNHTLKESNKARLTIKLG